MASYIKQLLLQDVATVNKTMHIARVAFVISSVVLTFTLLALALS